MSGQQKLDQIEKSIRDGDPKKADSVLSSITDPIDQHIFTDALKRHCTAKDNLPACTIDDKGIHFDGPHKMTMTQNDGKLGMKDDAPSVGTQIGNAWDSLTKKVSDAVHGAGSGTAIGDALNRANTSDSELNRRWDNQIKKSGG